MVLAYLPCSQFFGTTTACWWTPKDLYFRATRTVLAEVGVELTPEQFKEISLKRGESTFFLAFDQGIPADEIARLRAKRDRIYTDFLRTEPCLIDGVEEVLRALHGQVRMGVVTSTHRQHFDIAHARTGLAKYLDFVDRPRRLPAFQAAPGAVSDGPGPARCGQSASWSRIRSEGWQRQRRLGWNA